MVYLFRLRHAVCMLSCGEYRVYPMRLSSDYKQLSFLCTDKVLYVSLTEVIFVSSWLHITSHFLSRSQTFEQCHVYIFHLYLFFAAHTNLLF